MPFVDEGPYEKLEEWLRDYELDLAENDPKVAILPPIPQKEICAATTFLAQERMYYRSDPLEGLTEKWLCKDGAKYTEYPKSDSEDEDIPDDASDGSLDSVERELRDEKREKMKAKANELAKKQNEIDAERARVRRLAGQARGHTLWMRGRSSAANLLPTSQVAEQKLQRMASAPLSRFPTAQTVPDDDADLENEKEVWWKAPMPLPGLPQEEEEVFVWRKSFVEEVRRLAVSQNMQIPFVNVMKARKMVQRAPESKAAFKYHIVAVCSSGDRELWSQPFVQFLGVLKDEWAMEDGDVCYNLETFDEDYHEVSFDKPGKYPSRRRPTAVTVRIPQSMPQDFLDEEGKVGPPVAPPLPERLPARVPYLRGLPGKTSSMWRRLLDGSDTTAHQPWKKSYREEMTRKFGATSSHENSPARNRGQGFQQDPTASASTKASTKKMKQAGRSGRK
eukprot:TRINITY_DN3860_c3_g1_i3.p1 TRINITY_DN3860_c3_g1~~TRINITY_DN3860_c3_g1_i3.p1  ORF type:complete len:449 (-),score=93.68 TRINITY_DN3860_c3_g1_i3:366-1712(-)